MYAHEEESPGLRLVHTQGLKDMHNYDLGGVARLRRNGAGPSLHFACMHSVGLWKCHCCLCLCMAVAVMLTIATEIG